MPSSAHQPRESSLRIRVAPEEVSLIDWPLVQRPVSSLVALALASGTVWLVGWASQRWEAAALAAVALAITLWRTWLPVQFDIGSGGIAQVILGRFKRRIPWSAIQSYDVRTDGVLLVPDPVITPLSPRSGPRQSGVLRSRLAKRPAPFHAAAGTLTGSGYSARVAASSRSTPSGSLLSSICDSGKPASKASCRSSRSVR
jgi:hypothetical protein